MTSRRENPWDSSRPRFRRPAPAANGVAGDEAEMHEITTGRQLAWHVLQQHDHSGQFLQDVLTACDSRHSLSAQERAAAVEIASGVVRRCRTIDVLLMSQITRPRHQVETDLWRLLRVGVWQLAFGRTPDHAAVDTTVELCRSLDRERWTRFANGVLRGTGRLLTPDQCETPVASALPMSHGIYRQLTTAVFADPQIHLPDYVADGFSLPLPLAERWVARMSREELLAACFHACNPPVMTLRVNRLRSDGEAVRRLLTEHGCRVEPGHIEGSLLVTGASRVERLPGFAEGLWSVQDESAMAAALLLGPKAGERILDVCAAPGGKTCHLAELSGDAAFITACDISETRLQRVRDNVTRLSLQNVKLQLVSRDGHDLPSGPFDAVLVDVPCSNTGVLGRRPEARWRFHEAELQELIPLQTRLLLNACERVVGGGRVVYSTCSLEPEENRGVVDAVLKALPEMRLVTEQVHAAGRPADGAYQALLVAH